MSSIYILSRNGPSNDPCGRPAMLSLHRLKLLFRPVLYKRWFKQLRIYLREDIDNQQTSSFAISR